MPTILAVFDPAVRRNLHVHRLRRGPLPLPGPLWGGVRSAGIDGWSPIAWPRSALGHEVGPIEFLLVRFQRDQFISDSPTSRACVHRANRRNSLRGVTANHSAPLRRPTSRTSSRPDVASQRRVVPSSPAVMICRPSGEKAAEFTNPAWPTSRRISMPVATSQRRSDRSPGRCENPLSVGREGDRGGARDAELARRSFNLEYAERCCPSQGRTDGRPNRNRRSAPIFRRARRRRPGSTFSWAR